MQVVLQSGGLKNPVSRSMYPFSINKYESNMTTVGSGLKFEFTYVHPDTHIRSNQGTDWEHIIHYAMNQLYMKAVTKIFGTRGINSV